MSLFVFVGIVALFVGIAAAEEVKAPAGFPMTIELESFKLTNGNIVDNKDASGGKAVVATSLQFMATKVVTFKEKGYYELTLTENAPNGSTDAINVRLNGAPGLRIYPDEKFAGKFTDCLKKVPIMVNEPGDFTIDVFTSNEMGALYDKVTITYVKPL
jgi:hypothetical protein